VTIDLRERDVMTCIVALLLVLSRSGSQVATDRADVGGAVQQRRKGPGPRCGAR
jgi:hypothetical protein